MTFVLRVLSPEQRFDILLKNKDFFESIWIEFILSKYRFCYRWKETLHFDWWL